MINFILGNQLNLDISSSISYLEPPARATLTLKIHVFRQQLTRRIFHDILHERVAQLVCIILQLCFALILNNAANGRWLPFNIYGSIYK